MARNFDLFAGDSRELDFTITDSAGAAQSLTGATITWTLLNAATQRTANVTKTISSGITVNADPATGLFSVALDEADTTGLIGEYAYTCIIVDASTNTTTVQNGTCTIFSTVRDIAYCSLADLSARCKQITFSSSSSPTDIEVQRFIDETFHEINAALQGAGYLAPIPTENSTLNAGAGTIVISGAHITGAYSILLIGSGGTLVGRSQPGDYLTIAGDPSRYTVLSDSAVSNDNTVSVMLSPWLSLDAAASATVTYNSSRGPSEILRGLNADGATAKTLLSAFGNGTGYVGEDMREYQRRYEGKLKMIATRQLPLTGLPQANLSSVGSVKLIRT